MLFVYVFFHLCFNIAGGYWISIAALYDHCRVFFSAVFGVLQICLRPWAGLSGSWRYWSRHAWPEWVMGG